MKLVDLLSDSKKDCFYIMHLSYNGSDKERLWNYARDNKLIGLDVPGIVRGNWLDVRESAKKSLKRGWVRQFDTFCDARQKGIHKDDFVMIIKGMESALGIAQVIDSTLIYDKKLSADRVFFDHVRRVKWHHKYEYANPLVFPKLLLGFSHTLSRVSQDSPRWLMLTNLNL